MCQGNSSKAKRFSRRVCEAVAPASVAGERKAEGLRGGERARHRAPMDVPCQRAPPWAGPRPGHGSRLLPSPPLAARPRAASGRWAAGPAAAEVGLEQGKGCPGVAGPAAPRARPAPQPRSGDPARPDGAPRSGRGVPAGRCRPPPPGSPAPRARWLRPSCALHIHRPRGRSAPIGARGRPPH